MPTLNTTIGQLLINRALPTDMRDYSRELNKKGVKDLLREVAEKYPDQYRTVAKRLSDVGREASYTTGGMSFGLRHLRPPRAAIESRQRMRRRMHAIISGHGSDDYKEQKIIEATSEEADRMRKEVVDEARKAGNPIVAMMDSGTRGKPLEVNRLLAGDMLYMDHRENPIPFPVMRSYSEGLSPAEYWAATFGARKGLVDVKFATQDAGFYAKQMNQLAHRLIVTDVDAEEEAGAGALRGLPVDVSDADNEGALLASPAAGYERNTILSNRILKDLENQGVKRILVRSPTVGGPDTGGVYARDVGVRERGGISPLGEEVGLAAAQAISEKLTQGGLESKHSGGIKGEAKAVTGFQRLNQMVQTPKIFKGGATHAQMDGQIRTIEDAPAGGKYIWLGKDQHFVSPGLSPKVKPGDIVEAGDVLSEGLPNPAEVVKHKGIGEGRRYFVQAFTEAYRDSGMSISRRNVELLARGLIDHVEMVDDTDDHLPGDVISYNRLERSWNPREGTARVRPKRAVGKYLERPVLHYTIGTKVRPSMLPHLEEFGVKDVEVHDDEPPFQPRMIRAMDSLAHDPDWMTRLLGSNQKKNLLAAVHRGSTSDTQSTSFVPSLAAGKPFGSTWPQGILKQPGAA